jgi:hypothetical protein
VSTNHSITSLIEASRRGIGRKVADVLCLQASFQLELVKVVGGSDKS